MIDTSPMTHYPPAQLQVIALAAQGLTNREIAGRLNLPVTTVRNRVHDAVLNSGMGTRAGLVGQACRWGQLQHVPEQAPAQVSGPVELSAVSVRVLGLLASGLLYREMVPVLGVSKAAVAYRSLRLLGALGAEDRAHAVLIAWQLRIWPGADAGPVAGSGGPVAAFGGSGGTPGASGRPAGSRGASRAGAL